MPGKPADGLLSSSLAAVLRGNLGYLALVFGGVLLPLWLFAELADEVHEMEALVFDDALLLQLKAWASPAADRLIGAHVDRASLPDSVVLLEEGRIHVRSAAALRIARQLRFPWPLAWIFIIVPRPIRDWVYDVIARHRYRWFGKREECMVATPDLRNRFL